MKKIIFAITSIGLLFFVTSCDWKVRLNYKTGDGNVVTEERTVTESFSGVKVASGIDLELIPGNEIRIVVEADQNLIDDIITEVEEGELKVYADWILGSATSKKVTVTYTNLESVTSTSGGEIYILEPLISDNLHIKASSGSGIRGIVYAKHLSVKSSSGSNITLSGQSMEVEVSASSGSNAILKDVESVNCEAKASSGSNVSVYCKEYIQAKASSGANVKYLGHPKQINQSKSSGGSVNKG